MLRRPIKAYSNKADLKKKKKKKGGLKQRNLTVAC